MIQKDAEITQNHFDDAKKAAYQLLGKLGSSFVYHNKKHTEFVIRVSLELAEAEGFSQEEMLLVGIFALFHDTGFAKKYSGNEFAGAELFEEYVRSSIFPYTEEQLELGKDAIKNTQMKQAPKTKFASVLRDADLASIGTPDFFGWNKLFREESKLVLESPLHESAFDDKKWADAQLRFIAKNHKFFTESAKLRYEETKKKNINELEKRAAV